MRTGNVIVGKLRLVAKALSAEPITGQIEFFDNKTYLTNKSVRKPIDRTSDVALDTVTVVNTADETTIWMGLMPANSLVAGNILKFHADGIVSNGGSAAPADQITLRVRVGGVEKAILTPATKALASDHWHIDANATQRTIGVAGERAIHIDLVISDVTDTVLGTAAIDTTSNMDVTVTAQWGSAKATNTISRYQGYMEYKH